MSSEQSAPLPTSENDFIRSLDEGDITPAPEENSQWNQEDHNRIANEGINSDTPDKYINSLATEPPAVPQEITEQDNKHKVIDPSTGKEVETKAENELDINAKSKVRTERNLKAEREKAIKKTDDEFASKHPNYDKDANGMPKDHALLAEYVDMHGNNLHKAESEATRATIVQNFMDEKPMPDPKTNPEGFNKWSADLKSQLEGIEEAKKAVGEIGKTKVASTPTEIAEQTTVQKEKDKDNEASWMNAVKLAMDSLTGDDTKKTKTNAEIKRINESNKDSVPSFATKVKLAKVAVIAAGVIATAGVGMVAESKKA